MILHVRRIFLKLLCSQQWHPSQVLCVDVIELLRDPSDPSTEHTTPPCSAHVQLDDVPRDLDPVEYKGELRQHDGMTTVMMMLPAQGFA